MMDLISSATDICILYGVCDFLGKINKIDFESTDTLVTRHGESQRYQYRETCRSDVDSRIPGKPYSTVQQVDTNLKKQRR